MKDRYQAISAVWMGIETRIDLPEQKLYHWDSLNILLCELSKTKRMILIYTSRTYCKAVSKLYFTAYFQGFLLLLFYEYYTQFYQIFIALLVSHYLYQ